MKKRICWLFPHLEQDGGGTKFLLEVTRRLRKHYDITVICNTGIPSVTTPFKRNGISIVTTSKISANSNFYWLGMPFFLLLDYFRYVKFMNKADYILSTMYPSNFIALLYHLFTGKPYYYYCYEPFPYLQNNEFIASQDLPKRAAMRIFSFLYRWTDTIAAKKARKVFTLNEITKKMIKNTYNVDSIVTFMGVDTRHFREYKNNPIAQKYKNNLLIGHSTDYSLMKRTDLAIEAIKIVAQKFPSVLLLITSTYPKSPRKKIYQDLVAKYELQKNVKFLNYVSYRELPYYYSASICYASCSYDEMLGTTSSNLPVKEALACKTPAIRANITSEDVRDGISGFLVDPRNTKLVAEKLLYLLKNREKAKKMGERGRDLIVKTYTWEKVVKIITSNLH